MNKIDDEAYMKTQIENGLELTIVGVLRQKEGTSSGVNSPSGGVAYTSALIDYTSEQIQNSDIVKEQEANPTINVFTGKEFAKDPKPFNSADLTEEEKIQMVNTSNNTTKTRLPLTRKTSQNWVSSTNPNRLPSSSTPLRSNKNKS